MAQISEQEQNRRIISLTEYQANRIQYLRSKGSQMSPQEKIELRQFFDYITGAADKPPIDNLRDPAYKEPEQPIQPVQTQQPTVPGIPRARPEHLQQQPVIPRPRPQSLQAPEQPPVDTTMRPANPVPGLPGGGAGGPRRQSNQMPTLYPMPELPPVDTTIRPGNPGATDLVPGIPKPRPEHLQGPAGLPGGEAGGPRRQSNQMPSLQPREDFTPPDMSIQGRQPMGAYEELPSPSIPPKSGLGPQLKPLTDFPRPDMSMRGTQPMNAYQEPFGPFQGNKQYPPNPTAFDQHKPIVPGLPEILPAIPERGMDKGAGLDEGLVPRQSALDQGENQQEIEKLTKYLYQLRAANDAKEKRLNYFRNRGSNVE